MVENKKMTSRVEKIYIVYIEKLKKLSRYIYENLSLEKKRQRLRELTQFF